MSDPQGRAAGLLCQLIDRLALSSRFCLQLCQQLVRHVNAVLGCHNAFSFRSSVMRTGWRCGDSITPFPPLSGQETTMPSLCVNPDFRKRLFIAKRCDLMLIAPGLREQSLVALAVCEIT
jgi:hypothetical protein